MFQFKIPATSKYNILSLTHIRHYNSMVVADLGLNKILRLI